MSYPSRCKHNVIRCDLCPKEHADDEGFRERAVVLAREIAVLRDRVRHLEQKLSESCDENYDLKQRLRQLVVVNEELRAIKGDR